MRKMRKTVVDTGATRRTVALTVMVAEAGITEDHAENMLRDAKRRTGSSHLTDKGRLTVQYYYQSGYYRVTLDA
jgi:hypothetical protein